MSIGGSISNITIGSRNFAVPADTDATLKKGGYENDVKPNGDFTSRMIKTVVSWGIQGLSISSNEINDDFDFLQNSADGMVMLPVTITEVDGTTYTGYGTITGEMSKSTQNATISLALMGSGTLSKV